MRRTNVIGSAISCAVLAATLSGCGAEPTVDSVEGNATAKDDAERWLEMDCTGSECRMQPGWEPLSDDVLRASRRAAEEVLLEHRNGEPYSGGGNIHLVKMRNYAGAVAADALDVRRFEWEFHWAIQSADPGYHVILSLRPNGEDGVFKRSAEVIDGAPKQIPIGRCEIVEAGVAFNDALAVAAENGMAVDGGELVQLEILAPPVIFLDNSETREEMKYEAPPGKHSCAR